MVCEGFNIWFAKGLNVVCEGFDIWFAKGLIYGLRRVLYMVCEGFNIWFALFIMSKKVGP